MIKSKEFAQLLFDSSLDESAKEYILKNLDTFSKKEVEDIVKNLKTDIKNTKNILKLTKMKMDNEQNKFNKSSKKLELEFLKTNIEKK